MTPTGPAIKRDLIPGPISAAESNTQALWLAVGILVLILATYMQVYRFEFITYDDTIYVTQNPTIQGGLGWPSLRYAFTTGDDGSYLPLVWLSHAACITLFGTWAGGHHLVNVVLHILNSLVLFYFLRRTTGSLWASAGVAYLFALHPLHVESVAWVAERKDVLSTLFWLLATWAYVNYIERPSAWRYLAALILFGMGLLSKSMLVTLPLTLLLLDIWPLRRINWEMPPRARMLLAWHLILEKIPFIVLSVGVGLITIFIQHRLGAMATLKAYPLNYRLGNSLLATGIYLKQTFWPLHLSAFYPIYPERLTRWAMVGIGVLLAATTWVAIRKLRDRPYLFVGWFWYLITLLPVVGLLQVGAQAHADRYTYVPLIGIFIMVCFTTEEILSKWNLARVIVLASAASILGVLVTLTVAQVVVWRDNLTLFKNAFTHDGQNPVALLKFGEEYAERGQWQDAYRLFSWALGYWHGDALVYLKVGNALENLGRIEESMAYYKTAQKIAPNDPQVNQKLGHALMATSRFEEAAPYVKAVMAWSGANPANSIDQEAARINWAVILMSRGKNPEAAEVLEGVLRLNPKCLIARCNLAKVFDRQGCLEEAHVQMKVALEVAPKDPDLLYRCGMTLVRLRRFDEARTVFDRIKVLVPDSPLSEAGYKACLDAPGE